MPYMTNGKRDYSKEKRLYEDKHPERMKKRVENNQARAKMMEAGKARVGDGKDVDHKVPLSKGGSNATSNLRVVSKTANRSFSRTSSGALKSQTSKKGR